ncbi:MAG: tetratricopeptide repeat protein [Candidatus Omnitrophota bacterium]|nr:tetratricopeptide repeat protein [Candidatus Omnitrophota bacterium]
MFRIILVSIFLLFVPFSFLVNAEQEVDLSKEYLKQGISLIKNGQLEGAIEEFKKAIEINPFFAAAYYNLGLCCLRLERFEEAIESLSRYIESHPDSAFAHYNLGCAYSKIGNELKALEEYNKAVELNPKLSEREHQ